MNGAQWVVHALRAQGVETVFGYPGGAIMPIYDALYDGGVEHLLCRHEQGAAMAAIGYARATGKTGVCMATSGPGATNLITGLADALLDSVPVVAITGQVWPLRSSAPMPSRRKWMCSVYRWPAQTQLPRSVSRRAAAGDGRKRSRLPALAVLARFWLISRKISRLHSAIWSRISLPWKAIMRTRMQRWKRRVR